MESSRQVRPVEGLVDATSLAREGSSRFLSARTASRVLSYLPTNRPSLTLEGKYSIERMLALEEYTRTRSLWHVLWVVARTPLLPAFVIIAYELPPLAPPHEGWRANWVFFVVRLGIGMILATECLLTIPRLIMPELNRALTMSIRARIAVLMSLIYVGFCGTLAQVWGFPVPFTTTIANPPLGTLLLVVVFCVCRREINTSRATQLRFVYCCCYVCTMPLMSLVYPAYMALFLFVGKHHTDYQPFVTLLVPLIKMSIRKLIATIAADCEDLVPIIVVFSIELYNALFQVICVQVGSSQVTIAIIMAIDAAISLNGLYRLNEQTRTLQRLVQSTQVDSLLLVITMLCAKQSSSSTLDTQSLSSLSLFSALPNCGLSEEGNERLSSMMKTNVFSAKSAVSKLDKQRDDADTVVQNGCNSTARVVPTRIAPSPSQPAHRPPEAALLVRLPSSHSFPPSSENVAIVETTRLLFRSEYLLLGEYLECVVPWLYAMNLVLLWYSPNGAFYPHTRSLATQEALCGSLLNVAIFFLLEIASFVLLCVVLWKRLKVCPLHQLSYVLEHQASAIHAQMIVILIMSLHVNLDHAGADFSFQFQWLKNAKPMT